MANTSNKTQKKERDVFYYRQRLKNRVFAKLTEFFAKEAERTGITKKDIAEILNRDPAQITRWLSNPSNMTLESISDLLLALDAEIDPPNVVRFADKARPNFSHPLIARITGTIPNPPRRDFAPITSGDNRNVLPPVEIEAPRAAKILNLSVVG